MRMAQDAAANRTEAEEQELRGKRKALTAHLDNMLGQDSVLLLPTTPCRAPEADGDAGFVQDLRMRSLQCLAPASLAGLPQVSIPLLPPREELDADPMARPLGLSLVGPRHSDRRLLRLAADVAKALPVDSRRL